jgi:membrane fusion protein, multidrug efflux system
MSLADEKPRPRAKRQAPIQRLAEQFAPDRAALPQPDDLSTQRPRARRRLLIGLLALLAIIAIAGGADWWVHARNWVSTDDAFIDVHMVQVSPQVAGRVSAVPVHDNQEVQAGQPLVELDPADFQAKLDQAVANQESAAGQLAQARAQLAVAQAGLDQARAEVGVADANATNAATNLKRSQELARVGSMALSRQQFDNDTATARSTSASLAAAQHKVAVADAQLALNETQVATAGAGVRAAAAQVQQARLNLSYTEIRASVAGRIASKNVAVGDYVQVGQNLMALVPDEVWVTANFKETDLDHMRVGQPVEIYVDAYPEKVFHGHVDSFQAGSGAAFSLLPPQNATGNYVKVVQRVPVKIVFASPPGGHWLLGPGMSVEPYVKIR